MAQWLPSGSDHIIDHLNLELLLYIHVLCERDLRGGGHCSAECVDSIISISKGFKTVEDLHQSEVPCRNQKWGPSDLFGGCIYQSKIKLPVCGSKADVIFIVFFNRAFLL